ncbi:hypothetical protein WME99_22360 [Sorangium sp. So ce136]|uniref:hypothetical protein n=1 Tax=Sorangium sp. So ce136 TaxID=3133284 RepID=UPI003F00993A
MREIAGIEDSTCKLHKVRGYGCQIREWEERLDSEDVILVPVDILDRIAEGTEEWFYDLEAEVPGTEIVFGLHDSTALLVEAPRTIAEKVACAFEKVRPS